MRNLGKLKEKYGDEQVFVVSNTAFNHLNDGFTPEKHNKAIYSKYDNIGKFVYRYDAEENPVFQQIIPYAVIYNPAINKYYVYKRKNGSKENRLHGKYSMGFGGHINEEDGTRENVFKCLIRELMEELDYSNTSPARFIGYVRSIKSKTNDHTGLVFLIEVNEAEVKETNKYQGQWMSPEELEEYYLNFEDWGKKIIDYLVEI